MITGSGNSTPYDVPALAALILIGLVMIGGCVSGPRWTSDLAMWCRSGGLLLTSVILALVLKLTPTTDGYVGAWRAISLWPAAIANGLLFLIWCWRSGQL